MRNSVISARTVYRLPKYLRLLMKLKDKGLDHVSSATIADELGTTASQVRQDLSAFGSYGSQGYGYEIDTLIHVIKNIIGINHDHRVIIIGIGGIGRALLEHLEFEIHGFHVFAGFDIDQNVIGTHVNGTPIYSMNELGTILSDTHTDICILTVPQNKAQEIAKIVDSLDISSIWNFTNAALELNSNIIVENIDFLDSLFVLSYYLNENERNTIGKT